MFWPLDWDWSIDVTLDDWCYCSEPISLYCHRRSLASISWPEGDTGTQAAGTGKAFLEIFHFSLAFLLLAGISAYGLAEAAIAGPKGFPYSGGIRCGGNTLYLAGQEAEDEM